MQPRSALSPGSFPRPKLLGRLVRFVLGIALLWVFLLILLSRLEQPPGSRDPTPLFLLAAAGAVLWGLKELINIGLDRKWGWPVQIGTAGVIVILLILDLTLHGQLWGLPLAWFLFVLTEIVFGIAGINLILAGLFAIPG